MASIGMASERLGNTKARRFQLTLNEVSKYPQLLEYLLSINTMKYLLSCKEEAPTTGHEHIHVFVCFSNSIKLSIKKSAGAHIEYCRGSVQQNIDYIRKGGNILDEVGEVPRERGGSHTVSELRKIDNADDIDWREYKTWKAIKEEEACDIDINEWYKPEVKVTYVWGDSGVGKSKYVHDKCIEEGINKVNIVKHAGDFWHGVGSSKVAIYDDFRPSDMKPAEFINFIDYNKHALNIKGGSKQNEYNRIFITSVVNPEYLYSGIESDEPRKQWLRRMEIVHLEKNN